MMSKRRSSAARKSAWVSTRITSDTSPSASRAARMRSASRALSSRCRIRNGAAMAGLRSLSAAAGGTDPEPAGAPDQVRHRPRLHLQHDLAALLLDGGLGRPQLGGNLLVQEPGDDTGHHVPLACRQGVVASAELCELLALGPGDAVALDGVADGVEQILLTERLGQ